MNLTYAVLIWRNKQVFCTLTHMRTFVVYLNGGLDIWLWLLLLSQSSPNFKRDINLIFTSVWLKHCEICINETTDRHYFNLDCVYEIYFFDNILEMPCIQASVLYKIIRVVP